MTRPNPEIISDPRDLTPAWMTAALRSAGHVVVVQSLRCEPVGTGQMAHNERIFLEYEGDPAGAPATIVGKFPSPNEESRASGARGGYRAETLFYRELACDLSCVTPACHYAAIADDQSTFTLLLEDLAPKRQGDQIVGANDDEIEAAVRNLAGLHAPRWGDRTLEQIEWMPTGIGDEYALYIEIGTPAFVDRYKDRLSEADVEVFRGFARGVKKWISRRPQTTTLVHGDYRLDNLMFEGCGEATKVAAIDWQTLSVACGGQDLAYLLGNSSPPDQRRAHEERMLDAYREAMAQRGVELSAERIRADYSYGVFQGPSITMLGSLAVGQTDRGDEMFMVMAERCCAQIRDLEALALLE